jgi:hypothetical protein
VLNTRHRTKTNKAGTQGVLGTRHKTKTNKAGTQGVLGTRHRTKTTNKKKAPQKFRTIRNTDPTKTKRGWKQVLEKGWQFLCHIGMYIKYSERSLTKMI